MHEPHISVVIANHNYGRFLDRFLAALAAQTFPAALVEVIFVDDASTDDSTERARHWQAHGPWGSFRVLELPRAGRPGPVRNAGAEVARGAFLLFCDPDDHLAPDFLRRTHAALAGQDAAAEKTPDDDATREPVTPDTPAKPDSPDSAGGTDSPGAAHIACTDFFEDSPAGSRVVRVPPFSADLLRTQNLFHTTSLMRREVWRASRGFRSDTAYEDWDFWVQAAQAGFAVAHVAEPLLHYVLHDANYSHAARKDDGRSKACIVRDNPGFFPPEVRAWAGALLRGEPWAAPFARGVMPRAADILALRDLYVARMGAVRARAVFARWGL